MVNAADPYDDGDITIDGKSVNAMEVSALRRGIGYVFHQRSAVPSI